MEHIKNSNNILNVPYANHFDVTAAGTRFFKDKPELTSYTLERHDGRVFDAELSMKKHNKTIEITYNNKYWRFDEF